MGGAACAGGVWGGGKCKQRSASPPHSPTPRPLDPRNETTGPQVYKLPGERLYATYFGGDAGQGLPPDEEARSIWLRFLPTERVRLGPWGGGSGRRAAHTPCTVGPGLGPPMAAQNRALEAW